MIDQDGLRWDPEKVRSIVQFPIPMDITEVRAFLGICMYYRRFIKDFASLAEPLHQLMRKGRKFEWMSLCQRTMEKLKKRLITNPILVLSDWNKPFTLFTDASKIGLGVVLT